jgi:hypothetical protein
MRTMAYLWMILAVALLARVALGGDGFEAPPIEQKADWGAVGIAAVALLGIVVAAFKNARRTHLD